MEICCYTQKHGQRCTQTHTHEGGINIKTGTWREFCLLLSVACQCSLIISYALSSVGIHIWAINSNLTVSVSPTHMHRHIVGVFVWPSAEGGNRSRFLDFCNFILRDCALSTELVQPQWQKGPTPVFVCVCVCMWCYCMCVAIQREIEGRTQEEHNNLGQCSLHQSLPQRHWQATRLQLSVRVSFILTSAQLAYKITTPIVVWWFICHENRLVEWVLVCEGGWLKWEVGSYVTGSEVRWREGGTSGCGVHFPLFPVFCFVSAR